MRPRPTAAATQQPPDLRDWLPEDRLAWSVSATRYDKTPDSHLARLHVRASMIWLKDATRTG
ncbi:hypothetical protein ACIRU3_15220 [Streptomyces sp. NPDC101151]|uniref:hypothetical protein n=1 Tax=Streptomyces sp. NPDC101151 TaxID=3366115 RepID=UPI003813864B